MANKKVRCRERGCGRRAKARATIGAKNVVDLPTLRTPKKIKKILNLPREEPTAARKSRGGVRDQREPRATAPTFSAHRPSRPEPISRKVTTNQLRIHQGMKRPSQPVRPRHQSIGSSRPQNSNQPFFSRDFAFPLDRSTLRLSRH